MKIETISGLGNTYPSLTKLPADTQDEILLISLQGNRLDLNKPYNSRDIMQIIQPLKEPASRLELAFDPLDPSSSNATRFIEQHALAMTRSQDIKTRQQMWDAYSASIANVSKFASDEARNALGMAGIAAFIDSLPLEITPEIEAQFCNARTLLDNKLALFTEGVHSFFIQAPTDIVIAPTLVAHMHTLYDKFLCLTPTRAVSPQPHLRFEPCPQSRRANR